MFTGKRERALEEQLKTAHERAEKKKEALEGHLQNLTAQTKSAEQNMEQGKLAAGEIHSALLAAKNALESFRANHTIFLGKMKEQMQEFSEAETQLREAGETAEKLEQFPKEQEDLERQMKEELEGMHDFSGKMSVLALNAAIEAGRLGEPGSAFMASAEEIRSFAEEYETAALRMDELTRQLQEKNTALQEELQYLREKVKAQAVQAARSAVEGKKTMAEYETGQTPLQELILDETFERVDALCKMQTQMLGQKEEMQAEIEQMKGELTW